MVTWNDILQTKVFTLTLSLQLDRYYTLSLGSDELEAPPIQLWLNDDLYIGDVIDGKRTFLVSTEGVNEIILKSPDIGSRLLWVKLEKGTRVTDWLPAIEDMDNKADKVDIDDIVKNVDMLETVSATKEELGEILASFNEYKRILEVGEVGLETTKRELSTLLARFPLIENNLGAFVESWSFLDTYVRLGEEGLLIGSETGATAIRITDDRIDFLDGSGEPVAYITNQIMRINRGIFVDSAQIGEHMFETISDGHTIVTWMGGEI